MLQVLLRHLAGAGRFVLLYMNCKPTYYCKIAGQVFFRTALVLLLCVIVTHRPGAE